MSGPVWPCPCGSGKSYYECCRPLLHILGIMPEEAEPPYSFSQTILLGWLIEQGPATSEPFLKIAGKVLSQVSCSLDACIAAYLPLLFPARSKDPGRADRSFRSLKHNALLSILGGARLLSEGLLLQSGSLFRCAVEDSLAVVDVCLNKGQIDLFLQDKYRISNLVNRVRPYLPSCVRGWYFYFSQNFTHTGPLHRALIMPRTCWGDNQVIVEGLQNLVRSAVCYHICLERAYADRVEDASFWETESETGALRFDENSRVFTWAELLGKEVLSRFPPRDKNPSFLYADETIRLRKKR